MRGSEWNLSSWRPANIQTCFPSFAEQSAAGELPVPAEPGLLQNKRLWSDEQNQVTRPFSQVHFYIYQDTIKEQNMQLVRSKWKRWGFLSVSLRPSIIFHHYLFELDIVEKNRLKSNEISLNSEEFSNSFVLQVCCSFGWP